MATFGITEEGEEGDAKTAKRQSDFFRIFGFSYNSRSSLNDDETGLGQNLLYPH